MKKKTLLNSVHMCVFTVQIWSCNYKDQSILYVITWAEAFLTLESLIFPELYWCKLVPNSNQNTSKNEKPRHWSSQPTYRTPRVINFAFESRYLWHWIHLYLLNSSNGNKWFCKYVNGSIMWQRKFGRFNLILVANFKRLTSLLIVISSTV